ncbi:hypothetical protein AAFC00_006282 [Neodothiora populina]|uniref:Cyclin N-terminal domain-containing protein n=1 Tax=Neodothiora populina TaxID=2781224 RepID=A0ABR3P4U6_9PEZI
MDAKPQRPVRALRIHDENAPIAAKQTLHQKNKSAPALPSLMQSGAQRNGGKRAAFADVSNTSRAPSAQDDSAINVKSLKTTSQESQKLAPLAKPAQRPLAVKAAVQAVATTISTKAAASAIPAPYAPAAAPRKLAPKRSASVLKEAASIEQVEDALATAGQQESNGADESGDDTAQSELDSIAEEAGPVQAVTAPVREPTTLPTAPIVPSSVEDQYILALEHQALTRNGVESDYDDEEYEVDEYTRNVTVGAATATTIVLAPKVTKSVEIEIDEARSLVEGSRTAEDVEEEQWDTSMVAEYGEEIFAYMRELENKMRPNAHYMDFQQDIQWSMRSVLVDWVVQVHHRFQLLPETLFLACNYIDRFLSVKVVSMGKLQLVGATALFLAAKYEEVNCPSIQEIVYMVDNGYSQEEILKAERFMLSMLHFELGWPGPMSFLRRISKADDYDLETRTLAKYFLEITICDERFLEAVPSFLAAGAHCLARLMLRKGEWTSGHVYYSNYTYSQMRHLLATIVDCCEEPEKHHNAVFQKYTDRRFKRASLFVRGEMKNGFVLPPIRANTNARHNW